MNTEQVMIKATFFACLFVLAVNSVTLAANLFAYFDRAMVFEAVSRLQKRVAALEATQSQPPQEQQVKGQLK